MSSDIQKILYYYRVKGKMPTVRELAVILGYKSLKMTQKCIEELVESEMIYKDAKGKLQPKKILETPVLGDIRAGIPSDTTECNERIDLKNFLIRKPEKTFLLRVAGDSMKDAGIFHNDLVIMEKNRCPKAGDVVAAKVDGEWTLKYLKYRDSRPYLAPANKNYAVIIPREELEIGAVATGVIRNIYKA